MSQMVVSFGGGDPAVITRVGRPTWEQFAAWLTTEPREVTDKANNGWYIPAEFDPVYRHGDNFVAKHALTFDFDHVTIDTWGDVLIAWEGLAFAIYTTYSHTPEHPRFRVVMPLSRPVSAQESCAIARKVAVDVDIELVARESFTPCQFMYCPARRLGGLFSARINEGIVLDADEVLGEYKDWKDVTSWPRRKTGDDVHANVGHVDNLAKPGLIGEFNRAFPISVAIEKFGLPFVRVR